MPRNLTLDVLKGILIILVILGHCIQYGSGSEFLHNGLYWEQIPFRMIYSFHMPLFMGVAGFLSYFSLQKHGTGLYVGRRWKKLLPPVILYGLVSYMLHVLKTSEVNLLQSVSYILCQLWFLWAILVASTITAYVERLSGIMKSMIYVLLMVLFLLTPDGYNWGLYKFMFPCFLLGFYTAKYSLWRQVASPVAAGSAFVVWAGLIPFFHKPEYIYTTGFSLVYSKLPWLQQGYIDLFRYVIAGAAAVWVVNLCCFYMQYSENPNRPFMRILSYCGVHSLAIYIVSTYLFIIVPLLTRHFPAHWYLNVLETLIILGVCILVQKILSLNKWTARLIIGE